ncbi:MAG: hypothetical protein RLZ98_2734 [Pseudomonadota bacterium]|jgi:glycosyltransferase involved in cell wall biosynthesis
MLNLHRRPLAVPAAMPDDPADVCLIVEGCYPYIAGGVSSWLDWLMRTQDDLEFSLVAIVSGSEPRQSRYEKPDNLLFVRDLILGGEPYSGPGADRSHKAARIGPRLADALSRLFSGGGIDEFREIIAIVDSPDEPLSLHDLLDSPLTIQIAREMYNSLMPHASFLQFYWAWRALCGGLFKTLKFDLPKAKVYHTISTGYAGLLAARATIEHGAHSLITEHGIYTNERRIEILMSEWISDTVDKGLNIDDCRLDLRDLWIQAFESYAKICYAASSRITTLYGDNQQLQTALGAAPERLLVIANGIDVAKFSCLETAPADGRPTMALIGRVVPIKDTQSFIIAAGEVRRKVPDLRALVMGPTDEDPLYFDECRQLVQDLGLDDCVEFTGGVRITDWLPSIHVVVLSSLSEAQPLVLLEAGAAGIPCVATNVGACREIIEGAGTPDDPIEHGGIVAGLGSPAELATHVSTLLENTALRRRMGEALRSRVERRYATEMSSAKYRELYRGILTRGVEPVGVVALSQAEGAE